MSSQRELTPDRSGYSFTDLNSMRATSPAFCPLRCGFLLIDDYDHFVKCFVAHVQWWSFTMTPR
jgi:hypothetical protein